MPPSEHAPFWTTNTPASWPDAPAEMTVTTLGEIEACPRRWALGAAHYPDLWKERGYPRRVRMSTLAGTVVHLALEEIIKSLVRAGCHSVQDPMAPQVMKGLGGYTNVVNRCIDSVIADLARSPRAKPLLEFAARSLRSQVPDLRTQAQTMLCRVRLPPVGAAHAGAYTHRPRGPLTSGSFPEIQLRAPQIGWRGKADLLVLSPGMCEITEFKTGRPDDQHRFQIQVYALLWSRDAELNPDGRRVDRLVLAYSNRDVEIPTPTAAELDVLERHIIARRDAADDALSRHPPEARPEPVHCGYCGVRQLCDTYWAADTQRRIAERAGDRRDRPFSDIEVTVTGRHGPSSWDARVELSQDAPPGKQAVLRTSGDVVFRVGARVRVLDATITMAAEDEAQPAVIALGKSSETYALA